jgi:hypothetical protein
VPDTYKVAKGSEPALSLDGTKLAYVGTNGEIFVTAAGHDADLGVQITFGAKEPTRLTWNPDGQHVAYGSANAIESVGTSPSANSNPATTIASSPGVPAFLPAQKNTVNRIGGADPVALSIAASQARWPTATEFAFGQGYLGAYGAIITAPGQALGAARADGLPGPLLLTSAASLDPRTKAELARIFGKVTPGAGQPEVVIVGNEVSAGVEQALKNLGYHTTRKLGVAPPAAGAGACGPQNGASLFSQNLVVVNSSSATDNAVATSLSLSWEAPILRLSGDGLDDGLRAYLARTSASLESVYIVGVGQTVSQTLEKQIGELISGPSGYTTSSNPTAEPLH